MDDITKSIEISASGMKAQSARLRVTAENIANAGSTGSTPGADPYRRKTLTFKNMLDRQLGIEKVTVSKYGRDPSDFVMKYDPNHPAANTKGYVAYPNVDTMIESQDAKEAERAYEANISAIDIAKSMASRTLSILQ